MTASQKPARSDVQVEPITTRAEAEQIFDIAITTFCRQTKDALYTAWNPGWDTPEGKDAGAKRMADRWESATKNKNGELNTVFMQATVPEDGGGKKMIGAAVWIQISPVEGWGDDPSKQPAILTKALEKLCPGTDDETKAHRKFILDATNSLHKPRDDLVAKKTKDEPPAVFALDLCIVDPAYQGLGAAKKLVAWGIGEAERRGRLEMTTEGSVMGRGVYKKLGFEERGEIEYVVDEEFKGRDKPSNVFMTRKGGLPLEV